MSNIYVVLLAAVPALLNFGILVYLLFFLPRGRSTSIFALFITALLLWQTQDIIARTTADPTVMQYWDRVLSVGWLSIGPLILHFVLRFTSKKYSALSGLMPVIYALFLFFYTTYVANLTPVQFRYDEFWGWIHTPREGSFDMLQRHAIALVVGVAVAKLYLYIKDQKKNSIKRKQGLWIAVGISIPAVQGTLTQVIFPTYFGFELPLTSSFMTFLSLGTIIALARFRLFNVTDSLNVEGVLRNLQNLVLVVSPSREIIYLNTFAEKLLGQPVAATTAPLHQIFPGDDVREKFESEVLTPSFSDQRETISDYETTLLTGDNKMMHVLISSKTIRNNNKLQGVLLIANDITRSKNYQLAIEEQNARLRDISWTQSHVVRAPLARLMALVDVMKNHQPTPVEMDELLEHLLQSADELDEIVRGIIEKTHVATEKNT